MQDFEARIGGFLLTLAVNKEMDEQISRQPVARLQDRIAAGQDRRNLSDPKPDVFPIMALHEPEGNYDDAVRAKPGGEPAQHFRPPRSPGHKGVGPRRKLDHVKVLAERKILEIAFDDAGVEMALAEVFARQCN